MVIYLAINEIRSVVFEDSLAYSSALFSWLYFMRSIACKLNPGADPRLMYLVHS